MQYISNKEARRYAVVSGIVILAGLITALATGWADYPEDGFWSGYLVALRGAGWLTVLIAGIWLTLSCLRLTTDFFDVHRPITAERYGTTIGVIAVITVVLMLITVPKVNLYDEKQLSSSPKQREKQESHHGNLKLLVALAILISGASVASVPTRRFFGSQG